MLTAAQIDKLDDLATSLSPEQAIWVSGYLAGAAGRSPGAILTPEAELAGRSALDATAGAKTRLTTILYGSETGNSRELAMALAEAARGRGIDPKLADLADYKVRSLKEEQDLLVITSTHGEGDPPQNALDFFEFLESRKAPKLTELRFSVLALGDSTYEHYCSAGRRVDERLAELGGERLAERVECDVDFEDSAESWISGVVEKLASSREEVGSNDLAGAVVGISGTRASSTERYDRKNPFAAPVLENIVLTGRGSTKETRHVELSLEGSGIEYQPGDVLGVMAPNDPGLVATMLERLSLPAEAEVAVKDESMTLGQALTSRFEITALTPRFLEHWAEVAGSDELRGLGEAEAAKERMAFLGGNHVLDIIDRYPVPAIDPELLLAGLRPLQPRLYSIASSLAAAPDEVHLTVSTVRYELNGTGRTGVASGHLAGLTGAEATLPVYFKANDHFHLPDDETPIIMIGAGTGVAPYRAFMHEREARGGFGRSWLFFGERNFRSDFLYQVEWQEMFRNGTLDQLDLAFSRDSDRKVYVQDRLRLRGRELYSWLEDGACVYVCGDAARMAPDVHEALLDVIAEQGAIDRDSASTYLSDMRRDHRYRLDVY